MARNRASTPTTLRPTPSTVTLASGESLSPTEAAARLGCAPKTIRKYIARGQLAAFRVGPRRLRIMSADLDAMARPVPTRHAGGNAA